MGQNHTSKNARPYRSPRGASTPISAQDPLWSRSAHNWLLEMVLQIVLSAMIIAIIWWRLDRVSPGRRR